MENAWVVLWFGFLHTAIKFSIASWIDKGKDAPVSAASCASSYYTIKVQCTTNNFIAVTVWISKIEAADQPITYPTPGRSLVLPPRTRTTLCSWRLWPSPGTYANTVFPFDNLTLATLRLAELGFLGFVTNKRVQTPFIWGQTSSLGDFVFCTFLCLLRLVAWFRVTAMEGVA